MFRYRLVGVVLSSWCLITPLSACSASSASGGGNASGDAGAPGDGAVTGDDGGGTRLRGAVTVSSDSYGSGAGSVARYTATAWFARDPEGAPACSTERIESCDVYLCDAASTDAGTRALVSAGDVTVSGGSETVTLTSDADARYASKQGKTSLWRGGQSLVVRAAGGDVPAFDTTVAGPAPVTVTAPATNAVTVARSSDLHVSWSGTTQGSVVVGVGTARGGVTCTFAAADGKGTVPSAALSKLAAGAGSVVVSAENDATVAAGSWDVLVSLTSVARRANGDAALFATTLQ